MTALHNPKNPRHARLFELLRQKGQAEHMRQAMRGLDSRRLSPQEATKLRAQAKRSLDRSA